MTGKGDLTAIGVVVLAVLGPPLARAQGPTFAAPGALPTTEKAGARYLGSALCSGCHSKQAATFREAAMGKAGQLVQECEVLASRPVLTFASGRYRYRVERRGQQSQYEVTDGETTLKAEVAWCLGLGKAGQTWVFARDGVLHESRVSYFSKIDGLAFTMGAPSGPPANIDEAMGRPMNAEDVRGCFGCHTTFSSKGSVIQVEKAVPGVTCEGCHGPGGDHPQALARADPQDRGIFNPGRLGTEELSNFCGSCHRSWEQVMVEGVRGIANVRFQPYRLANSRCYDPGDKRIGCTACHDPHAPRKTDAGAYDAACLACHAGDKGMGKEGAKSCPKASARCSSCHMPRYEIPGSHFDSTDHQIRVVRPGEAYPN